jgi:hypothetical protein
LRFTKELPLEMSSASVNPVILKSFKLEKVKLSRYMPWRHMGGEEV